MSKFSVRKINDMLHQSDNAPTSDAKGDILENLIVYLFTKISGVTLFSKNILDADRSQEIDIGFENNSAVSGLACLEAYHVAVECKNHNQPIGSPEVEWFISKLRRSTIRCGIIVALNGITGNPQTNTSAHRWVISALENDNIRVLILERGELLSLNSTIDLVNLLRTKICTLIYNRIVV